MAAGLAALLAYVLYALGFLVALVPYGFVVLAPRLRWSWRGIHVSDAMVVRYSFLLLLPTWALVGTWALHFLLGDWKHTVVATVFIPGMLCGLVLGLLRWRNR